VFAVFAISVFSGAQTLKPLVSFNGANGYTPYAGLVQGTNGNFYGATASGGANNNGTVYEITPRGMLKAQKESDLYSFRGGEDGFFPQTGVIRADDGVLYGTTSFGGAYNWGSIFKLTTSGKTILYSFRGGADGAIPNSPLLRDLEGNLYGMTTSGGNASCNGGQGCGTVFKLDPSGKKQVLHYFTLSTIDGWAPAGGLVQDSKGNFYGATQLGGTTGVGVVFKLQPGGMETLLYSFTGGSGGSDGANPNGPLVLDRAGNIYGTTTEGGPGNAGVAFKLDAAGSEAILHTFSGKPDGANPMAGLIRDPAGNLYGTTNIGGASNAGTIFKIDPTGKETILYTFSKPGDGEFPQAPLVRDSAGNLYGNNVMGGDDDGGTVFKYDTSGKETVLHSFGAGNDGQYPNGVMAVDSAGNVYGATVRGGTFASGTVFTIAP
jgi:uncharacterized repeat protein (TIGR03803 family)